MISYRFDRDDLLRTRFAVSPLFEATASVAALRDPARYSLHLPWVRAARVRTQGLDLAPLEALVGLPNPYTPDFISPPPDSPLPEVAAEIERVARTPAAQVRQELEWRFGRGGPPAALRPLLDDPRRGLRALADLLAAYWEAA